MQNMSNEQWVPPSSLQNSVGIEEWSGLNFLAEITLSFYITTPESVIEKLQPAKNQLTPGDLDNLPLSLNPLHWS